MAKYEGDKPLCKAAGHDKRVVGVSKSGTCRKCDKEYARDRQAEYAKRKGERRQNAAFVGEEMVLPGLRAVRKSLGLSQGALGRGAGVSEHTVYQAEKGRPVTRATRLKLERFLRERRTDPTRLYGYHEFEWRPCEAGLGHPSWGSATLLECPRCSGLRSDVPRRGTLSPEQQKKLMEKVPDESRFDHALNEKGRDRRSGWLEHVSAGEETEVWG